MLVSSSCLVLVQKRSFKTAPPGGAVLKLHKFHTNLHLQIANAIELVELYKTSTLAFVSFDRLFNCMEMLYNIVKR